MRGAAALLLLLPMGSRAAGGEIEPGARVLVPHGPGNPRNSEADITELSGRLLLAWSEFYGGAEDGAAARIAARLSLDRGRTWGPRFVLQENTGRCNVMSVSFLRRKSGETLLFFLRKDSDSALAPWMRRRREAAGPTPEAAEAASWSPPERLPVPPGYHVVNNARVIESSSGRILVPTAHTSDIGKDYDGQKVRVYLSDDGGGRWRQGGSALLVPGSAAMEPGIVELQDGRLLMVIRTKLGAIWRSRSKDGGESWEEPTPMPLRSPAAPATIARIPGSSDLVLVWNLPAEAKAAGARARTPLVAAVSKDSGETWSSPRPLEKDPQGSFAYTSLTFLEGRVLLTYYREEAPRYEATDLILRELEIGWFYGR